MQHQSRTDLYWDYRAYAESNGDDAASYTLFLQVVNKLMKPGIRNSHLGFRKMCQHAECDTCYDLKRRIKMCRDSERKHELHRKYVQHLLERWTDRQLYWALRSMSREFFTRQRHIGNKIVMGGIMTNLWCLIIDGMDQAKFKCPRVLQNKFSKLFGKLYRPTLHVVGCWLHGWAMSLHVADSDVKKDPNTQIDIICRVFALGHNFGE